MKFTKPLSRKKKKKSEVLFYEGLCVRCNQIKLLFKDKNCRYCYDLNNPQLKLKSKFKKSKKQKGFDEIIKQKDKLIEHLRQELKTEKENYQSLLSIFQKTEALRNEKDDWL